MATVWFSSWHDFIRQVYFGQELPEIAANEENSLRFPCIGEYCASLIEDSCNHSTGIGSIPDAVLAKAGNHKDYRHAYRNVLRWRHSTDRSGVINNKFEAQASGQDGIVIHAGKPQSCMILLTTTHRLPCSVSTTQNDTAVIRQNPK